MRNRRETVFIPVCGAQAFLVGNGHKEPTLDLLLYVSSWQGGNANVLIWHVLARAEAGVRASPRQAIKPRRESSADKKKRHADLAGNHALGF